MGRAGWSSKKQQRIVDSTQNSLNSLIKVGRMVPVPIANFAAKSDLKTRGAQISFQAISLEGIDHFVLIRNYSRDPGSAKAIKTWPVDSLKTTPQVLPVNLRHVDADPDIAGKVAYYWLKAVPASTRTQGNETISGPQQFDASQQPSALQITGDYAVTQAYTPTTSPVTASSGGGANHSTIAIAAFVIQYPFDTDNDGDGDLVSYNSGAITPLLDATLYFVYFDDPTYAGGPQTYIATTDNPNITAALHRQYVGAITTPVFGGGGTTGGGGGGGACFSGNTLVITKDGLSRIADVTPHVDEVLTQHGWRKVHTLFCHHHDGLLCDMGDEEFVTLAHRFFWKHGWVRAEHIFEGRVTRFEGFVFNLGIEGDGSDEEQCFTLGNGWIAHNVRKVL